MEEKKQEKVVVKIKNVINNPVLPEEKRTVNSSTNSRAATIGAIAVVLAALIGLVPSILSSDMFVNAKSIQPEKTDEFDTHREIRLSLEDKFNKFIKTKDVDLKEEIQGLFDSNFIIYQMIDGLPPLHRERDIFLENLEVADIYQTLVIDSLELSPNLKPVFLSIKIK
jgi:hypothetical protein